MTNNKWKGLLMAASMIFVSAMLMAQGPGGGPGGSGAPIDGGIVALVGGAAVYAYKQLKGRDK
jgi:hypothetical protein